MKNRRNKGFTLAELLAVIAIMIILFAVVAVNVAARQRSMTRLEFDAIAKEIFIAAQNHLTAAESQNYQGIPDSDFGTPDHGTDEKGNPVEIYYVASDDRSNYKILDLMLPRYAVDAGGTYVIRYQPHPARVLDVFYSLPGKSSFLTISGTELSEEDYSDLHPACEGNEQTPIANREKYPNGSGRHVVGWYGGGEGIANGDRLEVPTFVIHNKEQLYVEITYPAGQDPAVKSRKGCWLNLIVEGVSSGAKMHFTVVHTKDDGSLDLAPVDQDVVFRAGDGKYFVLLDDITEQGKHFAQIAADADNHLDSGTFIPGENLNLYLVSWSSAELTNVAKSASQATNSLFADPAPYFSDTEVDGSDIGAGVAAIANFRHLENLEENISGVSSGGLGQIAENSVSADGTQQLKAVQISDMDWAAGWTNWNGGDAYWTSRKIQPLDEDSEPTDTGCFYPVSPDYALIYNGNPPPAPATPAEGTDYRGRVIKNVKVDFSGPAGLFGTLRSGSAVKNLELVDFNVTASSGDAGALIGTANGVAVTNVLARNSKEKDNKTAATVTASSGAAGGLVGSMSGTSSVTNSAAALVVSGGADAGGLIGSMSGGSVTKSYAGGHTDYDNHRPTGGYDPNHFNVTSTSGNAGGLIGSVSGGSVSNCYSTCSAEGKAPAGGTSAAGGLIGSASGTCSVNGSYATGLVVSETTGNAHALIGTGSASGGTGAGNENYYLWIINQDQDWQKDIVDNSANPAADIPGGITATDADKATTTFVSFFNGSGPAQPYDAKLLASYEGKYPMHRVSTNTTDYVFTHYGDWPMPETLVVNP